MSDYLSALAARAIGASSDVRPAMRPLLAVGRATGGPGVRPGPEVRPAGEPQGTEIAESFVDVDAPVLETHEERDATGSDRRGMGLPGSPIGQSRRPTGHVPHAGPRRRHGGAGTAEDTATREPFERWGAHADLVSGDLAAVRAHPNLPTTRPSVGRAAGGRLPDRQAAWLAGATAARAGDDPGKGAAVRPAAGVTDRGPTSGETDAVGRSLAAALAGIVAHRTTAPDPRAAVWPEAPRGDERSAEPPTIHVSIGRVEVRAVEPERPTLPAAPVRPAGPRVSLDEYLRLRDGGR